MNVPTSNRLLSLALGLGWLAAGGGAGRAQEESPENQFKWLSMRITEACLGVEVEHDQESRRLRRGAAPYERSYTYVAPTLELGLLGSIYHPNLAQLDLRAQDGVSWQQQSLSEPAGGLPAGARSKTEFLQRYHANFSILKEKPYAVTLFAHKDHNFRQYDFFNQATVDNQQLGVRAGYTAGIIPFSVTYMHLDREVSGILSSSTLRQHTLSLDARHERTRNSSTTLTYLLDQYDRQEAGNPVQQGTHHSLNVSDLEVFGPDERYRLSSGLHLTFLTDAPMPTRGLMLSEHGSIKHSKIVQSFYDYSYDNRSVSSAHNEGHSGQASVRLLLWERLTSTLDIHAQSFDSRSPGTRFSGARYGLGLNESLNQKLGAWGHLSLGYSGRYDQEERETTGQFVFVIETLRLRNSQRVRLSHPGVVLSSIRVSDPAGPTYAPTNYVIIPTGDLVEIQRSPGSSIPDDTDVQVDYQAAATPSTAFTTLAHQLQVRFDFFNRLLGLYGRLNLVGNHGGQTMLIQDVRDKVVGADFTWKWLRTGAEYEIFDSNLAPFRSRRLFQSLNLEVGARSTLGVDVDENWTTYLDDGRQRASYNFMARYRDRLTEHLTWSMEGGVRLERGRGFDQTLGVARTSVEYTRNKLRFKLGYDYQDQDFLGEKRQRHFFFLQAKRTF